MGGDRTARRLGREPDESPRAAGARVAGGAGGGGPAAPDPHQPRLRGQRQPQLAQAGPAHRAALGDRQARGDPVVRRRLRPQGAPAGEPLARADPGRAGGGSGGRTGGPAARPRHGAGPLRDPAGAAVGRGGPGPPVRHRLLAGRGGRLLPRGQQRRAAYPVDQLHRPLQGLPGQRVAGRQRPAGHVQRRRPGQGPLGQPAEVGQPARGAHRLHLRRPGRGAGPGRHPARARPLRGHRLRRHPPGHQHRRPLRALRQRRRHDLADGPDDHQHRDGAGPAARDRHPAAARLLRRFGARAVPGGAGPARGLRAARARGGGRAGRPAGRAAWWARAGGGRPRSVARSGLAAITSSRPGRPRNEPRRR